MGSYMIRSWWFWVFFFFLWKIGLGFSVWVWFMVELDGISVSMCSTGFCDKELQGFGDGLGWLVVGVLWKVKLG